jgi:hypothetical protein
MNLINITLLTKAFTLKSTELLEHHEAHRFPFFYLVAFVWDFGSRHPGDSCEDSSGEYIESAAECSCIGQL